MNYLNKESRSKKKFFFFGGGGVWGSGWLKKVSFFNKESKTDLKKKK